MTSPAGSDSPGDDGVRLRLDIAYDGGGFAGWARQPGLRTVQGVLEDALGTVLGADPAAHRLVVAGRTDAGVHARGQVAHVDLEAATWSALASRAGARDPRAHLHHRLRGVLGVAGADVVVRGVSLVSLSFDARFSALWRRYEYRIADGEAVLDPLQRTRTMWLPQHSLDADRMDEASRALTGLHDFAAYCRPREGATTIRTLQEFRWARDEDGVLVATVQADAFCHSMVRALVGAAMAVGQGRLGLDEPVALRAARERTSRFPVLAAHGLTLLAVGYPPDDVGLDERARLTRARRGVDEPPAD